MAAADFDGDGHPDLAAVSSRSVSIAYSRLGSASSDRDLDGVPDECAGARFRRGDADADGTVSVADAIVLLGRLFLGEAAGTCQKAEDWNDDGSVDLSDPLGILGHLFLGAPGPRPPHARCGLDATPDALDCDAHAPCA